MTKIEITEDENVYTVKLGSTIIAENARAKSLAEGSYPPVLYFDPATLDRSGFTKSTHQTHCPHKGDASYYNVTLDGKTYENVAWVYEDPFDKAQAVKSHLAFYPVVEISLT